MVFDEVSIVGDVIGAIGTVIGSVISVFFGTKYKKEKKDNEELMKKLELIDSYQEAYDEQNKEVIIKNASYTVGTLKKEINFDIEGVGKIKNSWLDFKFHQTITNVPIPFKYLFDDSEGNISPPKNILPENGSDISVLYREVNNLTGNNIFVKIIRGTFILQGIHNETDKNVSFSCEQDIKDPFLLTKEEVDQKYGGSEWPFEYYSQDIEFPTEKLFISLKFPNEIKDFSKKPHAVTFLRDTFLPNEKETNRIQSGMDIDESLNIVRLVVDDPIPGHVYTISWKPASKNK